MRMAKSHVLNTHFLVLLQVLDILTDTITVFDTEEECLLTFCLQATGIFLSQDDTTSVLVFFSIRIDAFNHLGTLFDCLS